MKKIVFIFCLFFVTFTISAKTITNTVSFTTSSFSIANLNIFSIDSVIGASYRLSFCPKDSGLYFGVDTSLGIPVSMATYTELLGFRMSDSPRDLLSSIKAPIGMRWAGTDKSMGFFLGGGPAFFLLSNFGNRSTTALGIFGELGFETNKTSDVGFFISLQSSNCALISNGSLLKNSFGNCTSLNIGCSWRRQKD
ncbi:MULTISPECIES: hypothetical protein [unclassified Oceanispirochaeta]|uniref:hypothetical protein n=1 Tax=unclassified Oceanispirochaeta TaxID=2635722 RepID=UPI000E0917B3|nr:MULTISPECIES: hypothetical protein [unclassified Oceanispirochaeta]MBF9017269.1 hypothetical protein [Oceanispirochaeta sp. M2]NPD75366.1 hypothetical protein [Oceanispirochaeta sp. M1]RDG28771.1 hypothetical protein DV872_25045 [Oceanispirochaeta sp. M1]